MQAPAEKGFLSAPYTAAPQNSEQYLHTTDAEYTLVKNRRISYTESLDNFRMFKISVTLTLPTYSFFMTVKDLLSSIHRGSSNNLSETNQLTESVSIEITSQKILCFLSRKFHFLQTLS